MGSIFRPQRPEKLHFIRLQAHKVPGEIIHKRDGKVCYCIKNHTRTDACEECVEPLFRECYHGRLVKKPDRFLKNAAVFRVRRRIATHNEGVEFRHRIVTQSLNIPEACERGIIAEDDPAFLPFIVANRSAFSCCGIARVRIRFGASPKEVTLGNRGARFHIKVAQ